MRIALVRGREVFDSRGMPTLEIEVITEEGVTGKAMVPSGASTGKREALELRDGDKKYFEGKGVSRAIQKINTIVNEKLNGMFVLDNYDIDNMLLEIDGTSQKRNLGGNTITGISVAVLRAAAESLGIPLYRHLGGVSAIQLPVPMFNVINGGKHADNNLDFQEFMIVPAGANSFRDAFVMGASIYHTLKKILIKKGYSTGVGDEGGFAPHLKHHDQAIEILIDAIQESGYKPGVDCFISLDIAASSFYDTSSRKYVLAKSEKTRLTTDGMIKKMVEICDNYPILSIEDPLAEDDWEGWQALYSELKGKVLIIGDDLTVSNPELLTKAIEDGCVSGVIIKPNQIGTVYETLMTVKLAHRYGIATVASHRSGDTEDTFIADLAVGLSCNFIKSGAPARSERIAKYNRLLQIEEELGSVAHLNKHPYLEMILINSPASTRSGKSSKSRK